MSLTVDELSRQIGLSCYGSTDTKVESIASFKGATANQLTFLITDKVLDGNKHHTSAVVITSESIADNLEAQAIIISENPQISFIKAIPLIINLEKPQPQIHKSAIISDLAKIDPSVTIAENVVIETGVEVQSGVVIGANTFIGEKTHVGKDTRIDANTTIYANTVLGQDCRINSGTIIGSPGFGIVPDGEKWVRFPQVGKVLIGDRVDIGANCCVDRGAIEDTIIESGVKLDNLIQVAHNVQIGENTVIAACTGIAGSAKIGKNCQIGGRASIQGHIEIVDNVIIATCTFVNKSILKAGVYSSSIAMQENNLWLKTHARLHRLDKLSRQVGQLEKQLDHHFFKGEGSGK